MAEEWRAVPGYEGFYSVSSRGRVRNDKTRLILGSYTVKRGYKEVHLRDQHGRRINYRVHRLVLVAFIGPCPHGQQQGLHFDGDPANNNVENLRWGSAFENASDRHRHGRTPRQIVEKIKLLRELDKEQN
jgi:hypothetical protein